MSRLPAPAARVSFFRLTALNILTNLTVPLVGLVDTAMLGHLADIRFLAGVALATILFDYLYWSFGFLRMGITGTTAQALGRGDREEVYRLLYRFLAFASSAGALLLLLQRGLAALGFAILSGAPGVEEAGRAYFEARIWGAPATLANYVFLGWYLGRAESRHALAMTAVGNLANVALNYLFIARWGWAAAGAGWASALAQYLALGAALAIFLAQGQPHPWRWQEILERRSSRSLLRLNRDILVRTLCLETAFALFTNFSAVLGTDLLAANAILLRILLLASYFVDGAAFASESLVGLHHGAGDAPGAARTVRLSLATGLGFGAGFLLVFLPFQGFWYRLLTSHEDVAALARGYAPWLVPVLLLGSLAYIYDGVFLGWTAGRELRNAMLFSTFAVFLPVALGALGRREGHLLWASLVCFMAARAATLHLARRRFLMPQR